MAEEGYEEDYNTNFTGEGNAAVMKNFFDVQNYVKRKIYYWQGFTIISKKKIETHDAIGPDSFIYSIIGIIESVVSQHNSVSFVDKDKANTILFESITALNESIINEPLFNWQRYSMLLEEFDHMLELFMGHVINGHGKTVATALQAGVIHENSTPEEKQGLFSTAKSMMKRT